MWVYLRTDNPLKTYAEIITMTIGDALTELNTHPTEYYNLFSAADWNGMYHLIQWDGVDVTIGFWSYSEPICIDTNTKFVYDYWSSGYVSLRNISRWDITQYIEFNSSTNLFYSRNWI